MAEYRVPVVVESSGGRHQRLDGDELANVVEFGTLAERREKRRPRSSPDGLTGLSDLEPDLERCRAEAAALLAGRAMIARDRRPRL